MIEARRKEGENPAALLFRFTKKIRQSGILKEARSRRFYARVENKRKRRVSAKYRANKARTIAEQRKLGIL